MSVVSSHLAIPLVVHLPLPPRHVSCLSPLSLRPPHPLPPGSSPANPHFFRQSPLLPLAASLSPLGLGNKEKKEEGG
uniref:Uncharacterized protein n=1 Tax=Oryza sativa subsp. japonica TaxID=39947 RepID=Q6K221_ORYSJ|nr:hypothetical protein [Oryza sativa Japonica Group]